MDSILTLRASHSSDLRVGWQKRKKVTNFNCKRPVQIKLPDALFSIALIV